MTTNEDWMGIRRMAASDNSMDRTVALARSCALLERAFLARGMPKKKALASCIKDWPDNDGFWSDRSFLLGAVTARNDAIHESTVPPKAKCEYFVREIREAWSNLRAGFVTQVNAAEIAGSLLRSPLILEVLLFGSLARGAKVPKDIDFLLHDTGDLSSIVVGYNGADSVRAAELLDQAGLLGPSELAAVSSGWMDFVILNEQLFSNQVGYKRSVMESHSDPFFFLNISVNLLVYRDGKWLKEDRPVFRRLAELRDQLLKEGFNLQNQELRKKWIIEDMVWSFYDESLEEAVQRELEQEFEDRQRAQEINARIMRKVRHISRGALAP